MNHCRTFHEEAQHATGSENPHKENKKEVTKLPWSLLFPEFKENRLGKKWVRHRQSDDWWDVTCEACTWSQPGSKHNVDALINTDEHGAKTNPFYLEHMHRETEMFKKRKEELVSQRMTPFGLHNTGSVAHFDLVRVEFTTKFPSNFMWTPLLQTKAVAHKQDKFVRVQLPERQAPVTEYCYTHKCAIYQTFARGPIK